jgi:2'-5' RNA ligase
MAMLPALDSALPQWAGANVPVKSLTGDGIETRPHVTVLYGFNPDLDFQALKQAAAEPMTLTIGKAERFRCQDYDVLIFEVQAPALERLHEQLAHDLKDQITPSEYEYHPHLTVAYVKRGALPKFERMDNPFTGQTLTVRQLLYSDPNKTESVIDLHNQVEASAATALADTAEPMLARLRAIARVEDPDTRKTMLQKFLADHGKIAAAMLHDDSVAREVSTQSVSSFVKAMNKPAKETTP